MLGPINEWVAILANWLSLASLGVSVYAAVTIARVRRDIVGRATLQMVIAALEDIDRALVEMLRDFDANHRTVAGQLARCEANLQVLVTSRNAAAPRATRIVELIAAFADRADGHAPTALSSQVDEAWKIQALLSGLLEELRRSAYMRQIGG